MDAIRVFVVDEQPLVRHGVAAVLASERGLRCVGDAGSAEEALRTAPALQPQVLLLGFSLPGMDGITALKALRALLPQCHVLMLGNTSNPQPLRRALAAGAAAVLPRDVDTQALVQALGAVHRGQGKVSVEPSRARNGSSRLAPLGDDLTQRERQLLALMAQGLSNQEIALQLGIAMPTVKFHITNILTKLHAENRIGAVLAALRHKLVELHQDGVA